MMRQNCRSPAAQSSRSFFASIDLHCRAQSFSHTVNSPRPIYRQVGMEALQTTPEASAFVPLAEHQSRTPSSFHSGPPVLHYHSQRCKVVILERDLLTTPALNALRVTNHTVNGGNSNPADAPPDQDAESTELAIDDVDTWVTSE